MESLNQRVISLGLIDRVKFTGFLDTIEKNPICLIPISGFIFGNIIVTSDIEFIEENINGWVAKYLDWLRNDLYEALNLRLIS